VVRGFGILNIQGQDPDFKRYQAISSVIDRAAGLFKRIDHRLANLGSTKSVGIVIKYGKNFVMELPAQNTIGRMIGTRANNMSAPGR